MDKKYILQYDINYRNSISAILYVIGKMGGSVKEYNLLKILFAADKYHLNSSHRPITGDKYIKEPNGTVPRRICYNIIRGQHPKTCLRAIGLKEFPFTVSTKGRDSIISSDVPYDPDYSSELGELELDKAIAEYGNLSFAAARAKNHQERCWQETPDNKQIPFELMFDEENREILAEILKAPYGIVV